MNAESVGIYGRILKIFPALLDCSVGFSQKIEVGLFMPLSMTVLSSDSEHMMIAIAQNSQMNNHIMASPNMEIYLNHDKGIAYAMTYQNDYMRADYIARVERAGVLLRYNNMASYLDCFLSKWMCHLAAIFSPKGVLL